MTPDHATPVALVTGGSQGLGLALTRALAAAGWRVVVDARHADVVSRAVGGPPGARARARPGGGAARGGAPRRGRGGPPRPPGPPPGARPGPAPPRPARPNG